MVGVEQPWHSQSAMPMESLPVDHLNHGGSQCHSRPAHGLHAEREASATSSRPPPG
jgi:hypothetical protein